MLGAGGFGVVYHGRMEAGDFSKEVALKVLTAEEPPEEVLQRFRDEARVLALIRDRAVVRVDHPIRLGGRWAVVMEFVEGADVKSLLRHHGAFPPGVAAEIIAEVARSLEHCWKQLGPEGRPLRLIHRDLKPANLQITPHGEVRILDFGLAKADMTTRETHTTTQLTGTTSYIAPERFAGEESQLTDVFSLGVVLRAMVTGRPPSKPVEKPELGDPEASKRCDEAMALADRMVSFNAADRPGMMEVEAACREIVRLSTGPSLRQWAAVEVPARPLPPTEEDPLVGTLLSEATATRTLHTSNVMVAAAATVPLFLGGALVTLCLAVGLGVGWWWWQRPAEPVAELRAVPPQGGETQVEPAPEAPKVAPPPAPKVTPPPAPKVTPPPAPQPAAPKHAAPVEAPKVPPTPPAQGSSESEDPEAGASPEAPAVSVGATYALTFTSIPPDAEVWVDGAMVGTTPLFDVALSPGAHKVRLRGTAGEIEREVNVGRRSPVRYVWRAQEQKWVSGY